MFKTASGLWPRGGYIPYPHALLIGITPLTAPLSWPARVLIFQAKRSPPLTLISFKNPLFSGLKPRVS